MSRSILVAAMVLILGIPVLNPRRSPDAAAKDPAVASAPIEVRIAIPEHHNQRSLNTTDHFHLLITNRSDSPIRLWSQKYSWGYANLSFEVYDDQEMFVGKIVKKPRDWDKNFPDWLTVAPGESYVLDVSFYSPNANDIWEGIPKRRDRVDSKPQLVKLKAVYEIGPDDESIRLGVWTGRIESTIGTYAIW